MANVVNPPLRRAAARAALSRNATRAASTKKKNPNAATVKKSGSKKQRVVAKKTSVRAPSAVKRGNEKEEEEFEKISIGSSVEEQPVKKRGKKPVKTGKKTGKKSPGGKLLSTKETRSPTKQEQVERREGSPVKTGRPKSQKPAKILSPSKSGRLPRAVRHFTGGQKHALLAKRIFTDARVAVEQRPQAIVIERAVFEPEKERRPRVHWTPQETQNLRVGVERYGEGFWSDILNDPGLSFNSNRTQIDLKDKWRNLTSYVKYKEHPIRKFVLVDSTHQMLRSDAGNLHVFRNRWPRDAALKAATKEEFYPIDENGERSSSALVHIQELIDQGSSSSSSQVVHVYRITRTLERPKAAKKFEGYAAVWTGHVEKVAEEILIKQEQVLSPEDEQLIENQKKMQQQAE